MLNLSSTFSEVPKQCFSTFLVSRHPKGTKIILLHTMQPLNDNLRHPKQNKQTKRQKSQYLAALLALLQGTLECCGTPVGNHCAKVENPLDQCFSTWVPVEKG